MINKIITVLGSILACLALISVSTIIILNSTFIYRLYVDHVNLADYLGMTQERLFYNYQQIVTYLQLPWVRELYMPDFIMSEQGRVHFVDVKVIFMAFYGILIAFIIVAFVKRSLILRMLNGGVNLAMVLLGAVGILMAFDFSKVFLYFHKLFFSNDYWIFNPQTDPIILALPEDFFMVKAISLLSVLLIFCIIIKVMHTRYKVAQRS